MEEILASIRRIMADDEMPQQSRPQQARPQQAARPDAGERFPPEGPGNAGPDPRGRRPADAARVDRRPVPQQPVPQQPAQNRPVPQAHRPAPDEAAARVQQRAWIDEAEEALLTDAATQRQSRPAHDAARPVPRPVPAADHETIGQAPAAAVPREIRRDANPQGRPQVYAPEAPLEAEAYPEAARRRDLLSPNVDAAVTAAFRSLGDVLLPQKERTVEDLVKEILRPMLKDWLDANLPAIVEALVQAEIERVARRPR